MVKDSASARDRFPMPALPTSMTAAVIAGPRCVEVRSLPVPEPGPGQVRVKLEGCGVCASNLPVWNWKGLDVINAHERDPGLYVRGMQEAARATAQGVFPLRELLTHRYALDELSLALRDMEERPEGFLKGWVSYD